MKRYTKGIHKVMADDYALADTYAQDGAFHSAAHVLEGLSEKVKLHAQWVDRETRKLMEKSE